MNDYDKYNKINEYIDVFKLEDAVVSHFRNMIAQLNLFKEKEEVEELTIEEKGRKEEVVINLESFANTIIQAKKKEIEDEIAKFRGNAAKTRQKLEKVKRELVLGDGVDANLSEVIKELGEELGLLVEAARSLITDIDNFKTAVSGYEPVELSADYRQIQGKLENLKSLLKEIKQNQIDKYNARVAGVNDEINKLNSLTPEELDKLPAEIREKIAGLHTLASCDVVIGEYKNLKYMSELDYTNLVKTILEITVIKTEIGKQQISELENSLNSEIGWLENKVQELETKINDGMSKEEIKELGKELIDVEGRSVEFEVRVTEVKEKLGDKFNEYFERINGVKTKLAELNGRLEGLSKPEETVVNEYQIYLEKLKSLENEVNDFSVLVESLYGNVMVGGLSALETRYNTLNGRFDGIEKDIETAYEGKKLNQEQYEQLKKHIEVVKATLESTNEKMRDPEMAKDIDVFTFLNGQIDGVAKAIAALKTYVGGLPKPIKDRKVRKEIDKQFAAIEKEIKDITKFIEKYKDENPEKYESAKGRLEELTNELDGLGKEYRKKCPLLVRAVKSAKNFYKKHKKLCLVVAGLAAIALVHATVGPILIPAIMHGNVMLGTAIPALGGFTGFVNNILGGMIGATQTIPGMWYLANGACITPNLASVSLLKGLAISGLGSAALLAPMTAGVVVGIKKLMSKIRNKEPKVKESEQERGLTSKIKEKAKVGKEKVKKAKDKFKEKISSIYRKRKNPDKETFRDLKEVIDNIKESRMSLDEFCEVHGISEEEKAALLQFIIKSKKENQEDRRSVKR